VHVPGTDPEALPQQPPRLPIEARGPAHAPPPPGRGLALPPQQSLGDAAGVPRPVLARGRRGHHVGHTRPVTVVTLECRQL